MISPKFIQVMFQSKWLSILTTKSGRSSLTSLPFTKSGMPSK